MGILLLHLKKVRNKGKEASQVFPAHLRREQI